MTYDVGNPGTGMGQAQNCDRVSFYTIQCIWLLWRMEEDLKIVHCQQTRTGFKSILEAISNLLWGMS